MSREPSTPNLASEPGYVIVRSPNATPQPSMISRLRGMFSSAKKSQQAGAISPVGMEMSAYGGHDEEDVESDADTVEDGDTMEYMDIKSEMFTSPPLTPRTPMMMASPPPPRSMRRATNKVYSEEEQRKMREIEERREKKWDSMLDSWTITSTFRRQVLKRRVRKGIPKGRRSVVWQKLVNVDEAKMWYPDPRKVDVQRLDAYVLNNIEKDIPRTFPNHEIFRDENSDGQNALRNVLRWYAVLDGAVNYCQGMSFTAGVFLTVLPEREAYYCFASALQKRALRSLYLPGLVDLMRRCHVLDKLVEVHLPDLSHHFREEGISTSMFSTEWIMTLFSRNFETELACRVLEVFLFEGYKVVYRVSLSILKFLESKLLKSTFETILVHIREVPGKINTERLLVDAFTRWSIKRSEITSLEKDFDQTEQGKAAIEAADSRRLREEEGLDRKSLSPAESRPSVKVTGGASVKSEGNEEIRTM